MESHALLKHQFVTASQTHGPLTPVKRIATLNRLAGTPLLLNSVRFQYLEEGVGDILAGVAPRT